MNFVFKEQESVNYYYHNNPERLASRINSQYLKNVSNDKLNNVLSSTNSSSESITIKDNNIINHQQINNYKPEIFPNLIKDISELSLESNNRFVISKDVNNVELVQSEELQKNLSSFQQNLVAPDERTNKPIKISKTSSPKLASNRRPLSGSLQLKVVESILEQCSLSMDQNKNQLVLEHKTHSVFCETVECKLEPENNIISNDVCVLKPISPNANGVIIYSQNPLTTINKSGELQESPSGSKFLSRAEKSIYLRPENPEHHKPLTQRELGSENTTVDLSTSFGSSILEGRAARSATPKDKVSNENQKEFNYSLPSGSHDMLNAHHHDGQMTSCSSFIYRERKVLDDIKMMSMTIKEPVIQSFMNSIVGVNVQENNQVSRQYLTTVFIAKNSTPNIDSTNGMSAYDILYMLAIEWANINSKHKEEINAFASEFFLQLLDVQTGTCPQGRVSRLWQIAYAYFFAY
jgi:hypothetical protein